MSLREVYADRYQRALVPAGVALHELLIQYLAGVPRVDRVAVRAKSVERFMKKALAVSGTGPKYSDPLSQIQDQIGARVVTFYLSDVEIVAARLLNYLNPIEVKTIVPDSEAEFGYVGKHFIVLTPSDISSSIQEVDSLVPTFFELQVKTLFQHAWAEAEHDLMYKSAFDFSVGQKRKAAFTAAQSWGADMIFDELYRASSGQ